MKALSIQQPWAWLIVHGIKDIENRVWRLHRNFELPQRVYVHAGKKRQDLTSEGWLWIQERLDRDVIARIEVLGGLAKVAVGGIVGEVTIVRCVTESESRWFEGPHGFVLADARRTIKWCPCVGIWDSGR